MVGGVLGRGAGLAMSDRESKERIRELEELNDTYAALLDTPPATGNVRPQAPPTAALDDAYARETARAGSYSYEYKDPERHGEGRYVGPMADELRRLPGVVQRTPDGEAVDTSRLTLANTSALGSQERRLQDLEDEYDALAEARTTSAGDERLGEYLGRRR